MPGMSLTTIGDRLMLVLAKAHCRRALRGILQAAKHATTVQDRVLLAKIKRNADSDYGLAHGFHRIRSYADFRRQVPLQTYDDIRPYIDRLRRGEHQALFGSGQRVRMFALTSGTCGEPKHIPVTDSFLSEFKAGWNAFGVKALTDHPGTFLKPILQITSRMDESVTEAGIPCGAISGLMAATQKHLVRKYYVAPLCVAYIDDALARYYTIMRLAIAVPQIAFSVTANPATQLKLARTAAEHAEQLIRDIRDGALWSELAVSKKIRADLASLLKPDAERAKDLERIAEQRGELLPKHYWKLGFLCNWTGGTLGLYLKDFERYFGEAPVRDIGLIASEGRMSLAVEDGTPAGILDVSANFYEFIPADQIKSDSPDCLRSHQLEVGEEYFIVLTNSAGFYRYDIGDKIRVTGFAAQAPLIEFLNRGERTCSMAGEKLTEYQAVNAVNEAADQLRIGLKCYVLAPIWDDPPYYRLHVELVGELSGDRHASFLAEIDRRLSRLNIEYQSKRSSLRLAPPRLNIVPPGFLDQKDRELCARFRRNDEQYKHQFLLTAPGQDEDFPISDSTHLAPGSTIGSKPRTLSTAGALDPMAG